MNTSDEELLQHLNDEKKREYAPTIAFSAVVVFLGIVGNALTVAYYGFKVPRSTTNVIITMLSTVDLITCVVLSDEIIELCFTLTFKNVGGCKAMYFFNHTLVITSGLILLLVAVDRFRRICHPFQWQLSVKTAKVCVLAIAVAAVLVSVRDWVILDVVKVTVYAGTSHRNITAFYCTHSKSDSLKTTISVFQVIDLLILIIESGSLITLYSLISYRLWSTRKRVKLSGPSVNAPSVSSTTEFPATQYTTEDLEKEGIPDEGTDTPIESNIGVTSRQDVYKITKSEAEQFENKNSKQQDNNTVTVPCQNTKSDIKIINTAETTNSNLQEDNVVPTPDKTRAKHHPVRRIDRSVTLMMLVITVAFFISFLPYFIVNLGIKRQQGISEQEFSAGIQTALRSYMLNNAINPYIIGLFNSKFRAFVRSLICKCSTTP